MKKEIMNAENFIKKYEKALASQDWNQVAPLMHPSIGVCFSGGQKHLGIDAVQKAYEKNFSSIKSEHYQMNNVHWIHQSSSFAVYTFDFQWTGIIKGEKYSGEGIGTSTLIFDENKWLLISEHLGKKAKDK